MSRAALVRRRAAQAVRSTGRNALARVQPGTTVGWPDERPAAVQELLRAAGIAVRDWSLDAEGYRRYLATAAYPPAYHGGATGDMFFDEKSLEHYASLEVAGIRPGDTFIDVASNGGPFLSIAERQTDGRGYEQDLQFPPGVAGRRIGGDAARMPVPDGFAAAMTLHCSFDHFEGDADTGFVRESARVLRPGGRAVIVPLYLATEYGAKMDPRLPWRGLRVDANARRWLTMHCDARFARVYDPPALQRRVLEPAAQVGLEAEVLRFVNASNLVRSAWCHFGLILRRPSDHPTGS